MKRKKVDDSFRLLGAKYLRKQARQLAGQLDGVCRAEDIEYIHRARVASRRLRAALPMFKDCFADQKTKNWRKEIRRLTDGLGEARDKDVQCEFLCGALAELDQPACFPGIARLLTQIEAQRETVQPKVVRTVERLRKSGVVDDILEVTKEIVSDAAASKMGVQSPVSFRRAKKAILQRLDEVLPYQESLARAEDYQQHHAMRIAVKRLRYTMELTRDVYDGQLNESVSAVKTVQSFLGDIHDCDVWQEDLAVFAKEERNRRLAYFDHEEATVRLQIGIDYLRDERRQSRQRLFVELGQYWGELARQGMWESLARTVKAPLQEPRPVAAAASPEPPPVTTLKPDVASLPKTNGSGDLERATPAPAIAAPESPVRGSASAT
ncbi:MAG: CHAD domain-containing protein [Planctomycetes bacterium]|nr:CHAD domain-containing protein [Planctomycetota bacterium]